MAEAGRFAFGENWKAYLEHVGEDRVTAAIASLEDMLGPGFLRGRTFVDIGCGSGLFSLAALRLGASRVVSFDYDEGSVEAARGMKARFFPSADNWTIERGSVLDPEFVPGLGRFDCVYSWGVLHHTGDMWRAVKAAAGMVKPGGFLFIALYNHQGAATAFWKAVKVFYNRLPGPLRPVYVLLFFLRFWLPASVRDLLRGRPFATLRSYRGRRGMSAWHDVVDWVGGLPFETASVEDVNSFCASLGFSPVKVRRERGHGCNEFVFRAAPGTSRL